MEVADLYQFVLLIVMVGMILGVGLIVLDKFSETSGIGTEANESLQSTIGALTPIATTWLPLIVTVAVLAIILGLVIRSFAGKRR